MTHIQNFQRYINLVILFMKDQMQIYLKNYILYSGSKELKVPGTLTTEESTQRIAYQIPKITIEPSKAIEDTLVII